MSDLLPPNATPLERAVSDASWRDVPVPNRTLWTPETCPVAQLPWLAHALSVDEWDAAWPEATRRQVIRDSIFHHIRKGTPGAVKAALQRLGYEVELDEKTGTAYTFRMRLRLTEGGSAGGAVADAELARAVGVVNRTKNVRSELIGTGYFTSTDPALIYVGAVTTSGVICEIKTPPAPLPLNDYEAGAVGSWWTVRMHSSYHGPIARVRRQSDDAELSYYSVGELREFVGAGAFDFLSLHCQVADNSIEAKPLVYADAAGCPGHFDANGNPYFRNTVTGSNNSFKTKSYKADLRFGYTMISISDFPNGQEPTLMRLRVKGVEFYKFISTSKVRVRFSADTTPIQKTISGYLSKWVPVYGVWTPSGAYVGEGIGSPTSGSPGTPITIDQVEMSVPAGMGSAVSQYGGGIWSKTVDTTAVIAAIKTRFNLL